MKFALTCFHVILLLSSSSLGLKLKLFTDKGDIFAKADYIPNDENSQDMFKNIESIHYIDLVNTGDNDNFSSFKVPSKKPWSQNDTDVTTVWRKLRFDPKTMMVNTGDFSYAKSTGYCSKSKINSDRVPFATAFGCEGAQIDDSKAKIDLRGTNFAIDDTFTFDGWSSIGTLKLSYNNQVAELTAGGYCGWIAPKTATVLGEDDVHQGGWHLKLKLIDPELFFDSNGNSYINLINENYSSYKNPTRSPWGNDNSDIVTIWTKVRFDPTNLLINTSDYSYSVSKGKINHWPNYNNKVPFGTAFGCEDVAVADGRSRIDLRGTKYAVDDEFVAGGHISAGKALVSENGQVVDIVGGGYCGWMGPTNAAKQGEERLHVGGWDLKLRIVSQFHKK